MHKLLNISKLHFTAFLAILLPCCEVQKESAAVIQSIEPGQAFIANDGVRVAVDYESGNLSYLGREDSNFAGNSGLWRLYYNTPDQKEIEITPRGEKPVVSEEGDTIRINYSTLGGKAFCLHLSIWEEGGHIRFGARRSACT